VPFANPGTVTITVTPQGGFTGPVNFACGTLPAYFSCSFASSSVSFTSGNPVTNTLTIHTALTTTASAGYSGKSGGRIALLFLLPAFAGLLAGRRRWIPRVSLCLAAGFGLLVAVNGCGGRGDHQAPDGVYSVPVNLTASGAASQTVTVTVSVQ
jgi:hypothetical protein